MSNKVTSRMLVFASATTLLMIFDLIINWIVGYPLVATIVHILLGISIILAAHILMQRSFKSFLRAEEILNKAQKDLEAKVEERTAELQNANEMLRSEIAVRENAEFEREHLIKELESARTRAMDLVDDLHLANTMLMTLIETLPAGMVIVDMQGEIVLENSYSRSIMQSTANKEYYGFRNSISLRGKDNGPLTREELPLVRAMAGITTDSLEVECQVQQGETIYLLMAASPVHDKDGNITHAVEITQNITPLKELEKALRASEENYRAQFDAFSEPTTVWNRSGILLMQNQVSARNLGGKSKDFVGKSIREIFPFYWKNFLERIQRVIDSGETEYQEDYIELPSGKRYFWTCIQRIFSPNGYTAAQIISYDITERRLIEDAVRSSEKKFSTVFHYAPNPLSIIRQEDGVYLEANQAYCNMLNQSRIETIGQRWTEFGLAPEWEDYNHMLDLLNSVGKVTDYELNLRRPKKLVLLLSIIPIMVSGKECLLVVGHDITERKQAEEALRLAQVALDKGLQERTALQERQRLARELHDSVSQALYGISLGTHTALKLFDSERTKSLDAMTYVLGLAQAGMTEMRALIFELRPESLKNEGLVNAINKQAAALRARHGIEVDLIQCEEPQIPIEVKEGVYRIALEAIQNAIKHARCTHIYVILSSDSTGLRLEVKDNGVGFDPHANFPGHLGLQSMRERAANICAEIAISSELSQGTQILLRVPIAQNIIAVL